MASSISHGKKLILFFNVSFLLLLSFYIINHSHQSKKVTVNRLLGVSTDDKTCNDIQRYHDYKAKCEYVKSKEGCNSKGYIDYLQLFYCVCGRYPVLGYIVLFIWLVLLFYLLGNTAANYFCSSLDSLSRVLKLSPTIAGVTLLSLGNGAPDVFASIVSFVGDGTDGVGFNSILGGAFFVSSIVVGVIGISIGKHQVSVDKSSFIRDVLFFILTLCSLLVIMVFGRINIWGAMSFVALYFVYVIVISTTHICKNRVDIFPIAPTFGELGTPLLGYIDEKKLVSIEKGSLEDGDQVKEQRRCNCEYFHWFLYILQLPLYLPRRLTIPVVSEEKWSKPFAVASVTLAPVLLSILCNSQWGKKDSKVMNLIGCLVGIILGTIAFVCTKRSNPPKRCLLPWLVGGFLMSVTWTYIIAEELVGLLVSIGTVFGISPSVLGLTLLAWGNSIGDLIANVAMAINNGPDGVQVAISGCYAGPIFNTIVGLGLPLVISSWSAYPSSYIIPKDSSLYETLGFLIGGLVWALLILPRKHMMPDRVLGGGLLAIYLCFLSVRLAQTLGVLPLPTFVNFYVI